MNIKQTIQSEASYRQQSGNKIENLNKMLDNQIAIVNNLFSSENAFDAIQAKLKQLQVKLSLIKEDNDPASQLNFVNPRVSIQQSSLSNTYRRQSNRFSSMKYQSKQQISTPFESLHQYKSLKQIGKIESTNKRSSKHKQFKFYKEFESGKKLDFDAQAQIQAPSSKNKSKSKVAQKVTRKTKDKMKSVNVQQNNIYPIQSPQTNSSNLFKNQQSGTTKQSRRHISLSSSKKINNYKGCSHVTSCKQISYAPQNIKNLKNSKNVSKTTLTQINDKNQRRRIQKQLSSCKLKNGILQNQLKQLRAYKQEYEKLRTIFAKSKPKN